MTKTAYKGFTIGPAYCGYGLEASHEEYDGPEDWRYAAGFRSVESAKEWIDEELEERELCHNCAADKCIPDQTECPDCIGIPHCMDCGAALLLAGESHLWCPDCEANRSL